jgi:hypothetical protein
VPKTVKIKQILEVVFKGKFNLKIVRNYPKITSEFVPSFLKKELSRAEISVWLEGVTSGSGRIARENSLPPSL